MTIYLKHYHHLVKKPFLLYDDQRVRLYMGGMNMYVNILQLHFFGIIFGLIMEGHYKELSRKLEDILEKNTIECIK